MAGADFRNVGKPSRNCAKIADPWRDLHLCGVTGDVGIIHQSVGLDLRHPAGQLGIRVVVYAVAVEAMRRMCFDHSAVPTPPSPWHAHHGRSDDGRPLIW